MAYELIDRALASCTERDVGREHAFCVFHRLFELLRERYEPPGALYFDPGDQYPSIRILSRPRGYVNAVLDADSAGEVGRAWYSRKNERVAYGDGARLYKARALFDNPDALNHARDILRSLSESPDLSRQISGDGYVIKTDVVARRVLWASLYVPAPTSSLGIVGPFLQLVAGVVCTAAGLPIGPVLLVGGIVGTFKAVSKDAGFESPVLNGIVAAGAGVATGRISPDDVTNQLLAAGGEYARDSEYYSAGVERIMGPVRGTHVDEALRTAGVTQSDVERQAGLRGYNPLGGISDSFITGVTPGAEAKALDSAGYTEASSTVFQSDLASRKGLRRARAIEVLVTRPVREAFAEIDSSLTGEYGETLRQVIQGKLTNDRGAVKSKEAVKYLLKLDRVRPAQVAAGMRAAGLVLDAQAAAQAEAYQNFVGGLLTNIKQKAAAKTRRDQLLKTGGMALGTIAGAVLLDRALRAPK